MDKNLGLGVAGLLVVAAVGTFAVTSALGGSDGRALNALAEHLPADTLHVGVYDSPQKVLDFMAEHTSKSTLEDLFDKAPFDIMDTDAWDEYGLDPEAAIGMAISGSEMAPTLFFSFGVTDPDVAIKGLTKLGDAAGLEWELTAKSIGDTEVFLFDEELGPALYFHGDRAFLCKPSFDFLEPTMELEESFLEQRLRQAINLESGGTLADDPSFVATVGYLGSYHAASYHNVPRMAQQMYDDAKAWLDGEEAAKTGGDEWEKSWRGRLADQYQSELAIMKQVKGELLGYGMAARFSMDGVTLSQAVPIDEQSILAAFGDSPSRDAQAFSLLPNEAVVGQHIHLSPEAVKGLFKFIAKMDDEIEEGWDELMELASDEADLRLKKLLATLNGEVGWVVQSMPSKKRPERIPVVAFFGLTETERAERVLKKAANALDDIPMVKVDDELIGETKLYTAKFMRVRASAAVFEGRLWVGYSTDLEEILKGSVKKTLWDDPHLAEAASVLKGDAEGAMFMNLIPLWDWVPGLMKKKRHKKAWNKLESLVTTATYASIETDFDKDAVTVDWTVHVEGDALVKNLEDFLEEIADASGGDILGFGKYQRRAKTTEAIDMMDKIYKAAALYYTTPHIDASGAKLPCQFPASQAITPKATCCPGKCKPDPNAWKSDTWSALNFQITEPHYFTYSFESSGTLADAGFTITAHADLDCDGIQSTFQRMGFGDPQANFAECSLRGSAAFYVEKETE